MGSLCLQKLSAVERLFALESFELPEVPCSLSFHRHPEYKSITREANEWAFKCTRRDLSPEEKKSLLQWKVPMVTCLSTAHAPKENMVASAKFAWAIAFLDDPIDDNEVAATSYLDTVLSLCNGTASLAEVPDIVAYRACHDLMKDLRSLLQPELFKRTVSTVEGWARSISSDDLKQDYKLYRRNNIFILPLFYTLIGASFEDEDVESPDFVSAQNAMLDHIWMVNDIFSFRNEFYKKKLNNLPAVLLLTDPSVQTFQEAVNATCRMIQDKEEEFIYYRNILAANASRNGKDFLKFLDVLSCAIPANLAFHYASSRYHGMDNPLLAGGTFHGTWILDPKRTIIVSDPNRSNGAASNKLNQIQDLSKLI
ncbi:hypothetical protein SELMODRAFT_422882 [Selaginella moellendorffii]|uniref:Terpene synthase n=1 Tax=Selaginella moellendorffii TaxID=88036 RepID=D8SJV2_SELML|nr:hypothetical protein SELMODRAFT_422882 [Selaginella moellendorffii]